MRLGGTLILLCWCAAEIRSSARPSASCASGLAAWSLRSRSFAARPINPGTLLLLRAGELPEPFFIRDFQAMFWHCSCCLKLPLFGVGRWPVKLPTWRLRAYAEDTSDGDPCLRPLAGAGPAKKKSSPATPLWAGARSKVPARGNTQTQSFNIESLQWRIKWETKNEIPPGAGTFQVTVHSAVSGRPLQVAVDHREVDHGIAYVTDDPRLYHLVIESSNVDWSVAIEEAVIAQQRGADRVSAPRFAVLIRDLVQDRLPQVRRLAAGVMAMRRHFLSGVLFEGGHAGQTGRARLPTPRESRRRPIRRLAAFNS